MISRLYCGEIFIMFKGLKSITADRSSEIGNPSDRLGRELVRQLYSQSEAGTIGAQISAVILVVALWRVFPPWLLLGWLGLYVAIQIPRTGLIVSFPRSSPTDSRIGRWGTAFTLFTILSGLMWGLAGVFLFAEDSALHQLLLSIFLAGISASAAVVYSPLTECYVPTVLAILVPLAGRCFYEGDPIHNIMGMVMLLFGAVLIVTGSRVKGMHVESLMLRFENNDLIESLTNQSRLAEELNESLKAQIDERSKAEKALRKSEQRLELAVIGTDLGLWDHDLTTQETFLDRRWA
ncbi:hypothetical protein ACFL2Q_12555 [Thermodesulfobacteriota bacterium]